MPDIEVKNLPDNYTIIYDSASHNVKFEVNGVRIGGSPFSYDWIVYLDDSGNTNAVNCHTGQIDVTDPDPANVLTEIAVLATNLPTESGSAYIQSGYYKPTAQINLQYALALYGTGQCDETNIGTWIDYNYNNPILTNTVINMITISGIGFTFGSNQNYGLYDQSGCFSYGANIIATGSAIADVYLGSASLQGQALFGCDIGILEINSNFCMIYSFVDSLILDIGAFANRIEGLMTITDNSGQINFCHNLSLSDGQTPPSTPSTSPVINILGSKVEVNISIGTTATKVTKNTTVVFQSTTAIPACVTLTLNEGESITFDQTTGVSWTWFAV